MELLAEDGDFAKGIHALKPTRIATAYIGMDWHRYVDAAALEPKRNPRLSRQVT